MVATQIFFIFTPNLGEDEPILTNIFGMGWFNHQLALFSVFFCFVLKVKEDEPSFGMG